MDIRRCGNTSLCKGRGQIKIFFKNRDEIAFQIRKNKKFVISKTVVQWILKLVLQAEGNIREKLGS